jgi:hypothetical protein
MLKKYSYLWQALQVYNSWGTGVRLACDVLMATRGYLVQFILSCGLSSAKVDILSKFAGFFQGLRGSPCPEVSFMACLVGRDLRTVTERNLQLLQTD